MILVKCITYCTCQNSFFQLIIGEYNIYIYGGMWQRYNISREGRIPNGKKMLFLTFLQSELLQLQLNAKKSPQHSKYTLVSIHLVKWFLCPWQKLLLVLINVRVTYFKISDFWICFKKLCANTCIYRALTLSIDVILVEAFLLFVFIGLSILYGL